MNTEYRNKLFNRIKDVFEKEETQEQQGFLQAREVFNAYQRDTFNVARKVVESSYPTDDVATLRKFKKKYGDPCDVVAKDKCFYFATTSEEADNERNDVEVDVDGEKKTAQSHFDFGLYGSLNGSEYSRNDDEKKAFAYSYFREELKEKGLNPDIIAQMKNKEDNPHKTKHIELNDKFLGYSGYSSYNSDNDNSTGLTKKFDSKYYVDIIGTSHCRQRAIPCSR